MRTYHHSEYAYVEANENNCWEENPNEILLGYEYIAIKDNE